MEYFRDEKYCVRASFAGRLLALMKQYDNFSCSLKPTEKYDVTLALCVFQNLLTNCSELIDVMKKNHPDRWNQQVSDISGTGEFTLSMIKTNTHRSSHPTKAEFLEHLRNAMSHPSWMGATKNEFPTTGYTSLSSSGLIEKIIFVDSPFVDEGRLCFSKRIKSSEKSCKREASNKRLNDLMKKYMNRGIANLSIQPLQNGDEVIMKDGEIFVPVFEAEICVEDIKEIIKSLAHELSHPAITDWDGKTFLPLAA